MCDMLVIDYMYLDYIRTMHGSLAKKISRTNSGIWYRFGTGFIKNIHLFIYWTCWTKWKRNKFKIRFHFCVIASFTEMTNLRIWYRFYTIIYFHSFIHSLKSVEQIENGICLKFVLAYRTGNHKDWYRFYTVQSFHLFTYSFIHSFIEPCLSNWKWNMFKIRINVISMLVLYFTKNGRDKYKNMGHLSTI